MVPFRGDAKHRTMVRNCAPENLEIPGLRFAHPGMTTGTHMAKDTTGRLHVTVKTGGKRKLSSKLWLERQLNDPYVALARRDGYRSRAAYKLIEMDDKHHLLKPGLPGFGLGAAPGGWSQIAAKRTGAANG